ncbi:acetyltransferase [Longimicrobium terrae]|uniref:Sugar O-acyltransferase (Sialic acid O-acetyltransferase NeuD family) n=1 Tax=Longimicrobium terrae TaxID=1639882 RepID=A0A841GMQ7_9BACT|nr:acetyltransferase [Longimicrobium terrae]MBB4634518.1 sugar O-acyltransferase (sialic acid O-acetyltransferase NeuD family) [Longimicrobium terrae]MBB6068592.1 sugar O-acyltransferase (sialic acid O-acetyltransferase NeuD family) [Longimicrobium terrae]NNC27779.1 acetyltransferase [Longimicrobium terrae]
MVQPLVIVGAGGHGREMAALVAEINAAAPRWELLGFVDDGREPGTAVGDSRVLGGAEWLLNSTIAPHVVLGLGSPALKRRLAERLRPRVAGFPALVHPGVTLHPSARVGEGVQVCAGCVVTVDLEIGAFATLNRLCTVSHDCRVGEYATLAPGVLLAGAVHVGEGADLGIGCSVIQGVRIGAWSIVGAGAAVVRDLPADCTAVGVPARPIRQRAAGWYLN